MLRIAYALVTAVIHQNVLKSRWPLCNMYGDGPLRPNWERGLPMSSFVLSAFADEICDDLDGQMDVLSRHGISHIEFRGADGKGIADYTLEQAAKARARMAQRGFTASALGSPIGKYPINEPFAPHFDTFRHVVDLAQAFGTPYIRVFSFFLPPQDDPARYRGEVMTRMKAFADYAETNDVILLHENEKQIYGDIAARCRDILDTVNSPALWATYDPSNFVQCGERNWPDAYRLLRDRIRYVHMKDSVYTKEEAKADKGFEVAVLSDAHRPVGQGDGNCREILRDLWATGYEGFLSIEPHLTNNNAIPGTGADKFDVAAAALIKLVAEVTA